MSESDALFTNTWFQSSSLSLSFFSSLSLSLSFLQLSSLLSDEDGEEKDEGEKESMVQM